MTVAECAAQAYVGVDALIKNQDDVLSFLGEKEQIGGPLDKILVIAVLAFCGGVDADDDPAHGAHDAVDGAGQGAAECARPRLPRYMTPTTSTVLIGTFSVAWYVGLTIVSENILFDSIAALGLMIAFYYGLTGYAVLYYRRELLVEREAFLLVGIVPLVGALILTAVSSSRVSTSPTRTTRRPATPGSGSARPLIIGVGFLVFGVILMIIWYLGGHRSFSAAGLDFAPPEGLGS